MTDPIREVGPREDVGAETLARYRFQSEVASRPVFATLSGRVRAVICEWHEDHVIFFEDGSSELVSVKHREPDQGPWTLALLSSDALPHLFSRWRDTGKRSTCLLATNGALKSQARALAEACAGQDDSTLGELAAELAAKLGATSVSEAHHFLRILTIEAELPSRKDIAASNLHSYVRPALTAAGLDERVAEATYEAVVAKIETASRDRFAASHVLLEYIGNPDRLRIDVERGRLLEARTITADHVRLAVSQAGTAGRPLLAPRAVSRATNLVRKLEAGGFGPTQIESAQRLRAVWTEFEAAHRSGLPGVDDELEDLRSRVQASAGEAEGDARRARTPGQTYGLEMYASMKNHVRSELIGLPRSLPIDDRLLEGLVYQLTDECPVWWSDRIDVVGA